MIALPEQFITAAYRFTLITLEPLTMNPIKSSALRGAFGNLLKSLVCRWPKACHKACQEKNACPYGYIFETSPPDESEVLRKIQNVPRPFIIRPPRDRRTHLPAGTRIAFEVVLIGHCIRLLPYFIAVFQELGQQGLGRNRGQYHLAQVELISPYQKTYEVVYDADDGLIRDIDTYVTPEDVLAYAQQFVPASQLTIHFLTSTQLIKGKKVCREPAFAVLIRTLLSRLSSLSYFHCGQPLEVDFRGLIDRANTVSLIHQEMAQSQWSRFSSRQGRRINMGGFIGQATYEGELTPYLSLLALGELIHVGKQTVFGNGRYRLEQV